MLLTNIEQAINCISEWIWGWPLVIFIIAASIIITIALTFIQVRSFADAWRYLFSPEKGDATNSAHYITPFQAFLNTLSASLGNGSAAGMATAMYSGGPGAAFWIFILGFFNMAVRFAEVYTSTAYTHKSATGDIRGGPMIFLNEVAGKKFLPALYAFFCLLTAFVAGSAMQCNSMSIGLQRISGAPATTIAGLLLIFALYSMFGGAQRIIAIADYVIPVKVFLFFTATIIALFHHAANIIPALKIIFECAFSTQAIAGACAGHTLQQALRYGISRSLSATEAGLGTAGILFGATASKNPLRSGIMSMTSIVISNHLVCFVLMVLFVASGVWNSGLTSTALTCAAYETVFGSFGGLLVTFLSVAFGLGVLVVYAYIGRECWIFLTQGKALWIYNTIFCLMAFYGALAQASCIWNAVDIANAGMLIINVYGILMLLPRIRKKIIT